MNHAKHGQIVTFYSYKGGTGRTMALANVAWILASNGQRVLAVDWDLESPGLHRFFHPFLSDSTLVATPGVIDIISDYAWAATNSKSRRRDWHVKYARVLPQAVSLNWEQFPGSGTLDFISAGRQNRDYSSAVSFFDWDNFYDRLGGGRFIDAMRDDMRRNYDYIFIDSRTGLSDIADICTVQFPDILVDCFTLNDQSIDGASAVARHIADRYHARGIRILPVSMRIEDGEKEKLDIGRALARARFDRFPDGLSAEERAQYWAAVEVPYKPYYAFEEILATFGDEAGSPTSLLAAFERLTAAITQNRVTSMPPLPESVRLRFLQMFTRHQLTQSANVFLCYVPEDRVWADWIEWVLARCGFRVHPYSVASQSDLGENVEVDKELAAASQIIVVLSLAYQRSTEARAFWQVLYPDEGHIGRKLVTVRVDEARVTAPFSDQSWIDLGSLDAEASVVALTRALGQADRSLQVSATPADGGPRFPGTAPEVWNVPQRNADFTGRGPILERLRNELIGGGTAVVLPCALYGLGGVGKTQVALEYAYRFMSDYDLVLVDPSRRERPDQSFAGGARY